MDEHVAGHDPGHRRAFAHHRRPRHAAQQLAPGLRPLDRVGTDDHAMIGEARRQRSHERVHRRRVGALHREDLVEEDDVLGLAEIDPASLGEPLARLLAAAARRVEDGEIGVDEDEPPILPANRRHLLRVRTAQFRPQQVPARVADHAIAVGVSGVEFAQGVQMVVADGEHHVARRHQFLRHPAQLLLGGHQPRHLLVERGDAVAGGARLGHGRAVAGGQRLEHDDARRHRAQVLVDHPLPADDHLVAAVDGEVAQEQLGMQLARGYFDRQIEEWPDRAIMGTRR